MIRRASLVGWLIAMLCGAALWAAGFKIIGVY